MTAKSISTLFFLFRLFEREPNDVVDARQLKVIIVHALQTLHGQVWYIPYTLVHVLHSLMYSCMGSNGDCLIKDRK